MMVSEIAFWCPNCPILGCPKLMSSRSRNIFYLGFWLLLRKTRVPKMYVNNHIENSVKNEFWRWSFRYTWHFDKFQKTKRLRKARFRNGRYEFAWVSSWFPWHAPVQPAVVKAIDPSMPMPKDQRIYHYAETMFKKCGMRMALGLTWTYTSPIQPWLE